MPRRFVTANVWSRCGASAAVFFFTTTQVPLAPVGDTDTVKFRTDALSGSPQTAPGSTAMPFTSTYAGSLTVSDRGASVRLDQPERSDWSSACRGPQPS